MQYRRTFYYRRTFTLSSASCYDYLFLEARVENGMVVYLNNVEVLRFNLPSGPVDNSTLVSPKFDPRSHALKKIPDFVLNFHKIKYLILL